MTDKQQQHQPWPWDEIKALMAKYDNVRDLGAYFNKLTNLNDVIEDLLFNNTPQDILQALREDTRNNRGVLGTESSAEEVKQKLKNEIHRLLFNKCGQATTNHAVAIVDRAFDSGLTN